MTLNEFIVKTYNPIGSYSYKIVMRPRIVCNDGFSMSVQAHEFAYCTPRITTNCYTAMEVGFPSEVEDLLLEYAEEPEYPTTTVYPYTPTELIEQVILKHGGINVEESLITN